MGLLSYSPMTSTWTSWESPARQKHPLTGETYYTTQVQPVAVVRGKTPEECLKNARLIATTPDLLQLCHDLFHTLCDLTHIGETPDEDLEEGELDLVQTYYAVTGKAEGREVTEPSAS